MLIRSILLWLLFAGICLAQPPRLWRDLVTVASRQTTTALPWWRDTNNIAMAFYSWHTNAGNGRWDQDAGNFYATNAVTGIRRAIDIGGGAIVLAVTNTYLDVIGTTHMFTGTRQASMFGWFSVAPAQEVANAPLLACRSPGLSLLGIAGGSTFLNGMRGYWSTSDTAQATTPFLTAAFQYEWISVCSTYSNGIVLLYTNGVLTGISNLTENALYNGDIMRIGYDDANAARTFEGYLDWIGALTNRALTSNEVAAWDSATYPPSTIP